MSRARYSEQEHVDAPPETVFEYRLDYGANLPAYNPNVSKMQRTDGGSDLGPGAAYSFEVEIENMGSMPTTLTVLEAEHPDRIVNEMGSGLIKAREECTFAPSDGGTLITFDVTITFPDEMGDEIVEIAERSGREQVRLELELIKKALES